MLVWLVILVRVVSNPVSNVFQKLLTRKAAGPLFIILATHALLSLVGLPIFLPHARELSNAFWWNLLVVAALTVIAGRLRWGRLLLRVGAVGALVGLAVYSVVEQVQYHYLPTINWAANMSSANDIAWAAICLLGADVVVGGLRARTTERGGYGSKVCGGRERQERRWPSSV